MAQPEKKIISPETYFEMEKTAEYKSEYYHGEIFAMTGATVRHNLIVMNISAKLYNQLQDSDCWVFPSDIKVQVDEAVHYAYPDVSIVCGDVEFVEGRNDVVTNPLVIFEVLSESTKDYDRGSKFLAYRNISSLRDYLVVDQFSFSVEHFSMSAPGQWVLTDCRGLEDAVSLGSVDARLTMKEIYHRIDLNRPTP